MAMFHHRELVLNAQVPLRTRMKTILRRRRQMIARLMSQGRPKVTRVIRSLLWRRGDAPSRSSLILMRWNTLCHARARRIIARDAAASVKRVLNQSVENVKAAGWLVIPAITFTSGTDAI